MAACKLNVVYLLICVESTILLQYSGGNTIGIGSFETCYRKGTGHVERFAIYNRG